MFTHIIPCGKEESMIPEHLSAPGQLLLGSVRRLDPLVCVFIFFDPGTQQRLILEQVHLSMFPLLCRVNSQAAKFVVDVHEYLSEYSTVLDTVYFHSPLQHYFKFHLNYRNIVANDKLIGDMIVFNGLCGEQHKITSYDGFELELFKINSSKDPNRSRHRQSVLLVHGVFQDCEVFLCGGQDNLVSTLVEAGFDVWLLNNRGSKYCNFEPNYDNINSISPRAHSDDICETVRYIINAQRRSDTSIDTANSTFLDDKIFCVGFSSGCALLHSALDSGNSSDEFQSNACNNNSVSQFIKGVVYLSPILYLLPDSLMSTSQCQGHSQIIINSSSKAKISPVVASILRDPLRIYPLFNCNPVVVPATATPNSTTEVSPALQRGARFDKSRTFKSQFIANQDSCSDSESVSSHSECERPSMLCSSLSQWRDILSAKTYAYAASRLAGRLFGWDFRNIEDRRRRVLLPHLFSPTHANHAVVQLQSLLRNGKQLLVGSNSSIGRDDNDISRHRHNSSSGYTFPLLRFQYNLVRWVVSTYYRISATVLRFLLSPLKKLFGSTSNSNSSVDVKSKCISGTHTSGSSGNEYNLFSNLRCPLTVVTGSLDSLVDSDLLRRMAETHNINYHRNNDRSGSNSVKSDDCSDQGARNCAAVVRVVEMSQYEHMDVLWANYAQSKVFRGVVLKALMGTSDEQ